MAWNFFRGLFGGTHTEIDNRALRDVTIAFVRHGRSPLDDAMVMRLWSTPAWHAVLMEFVSAIENLVNNRNIGFTLNGEKGRWWWWGDSIYFTEGDYGAIWRVKSLLITCWGLIPKEMRGSMLSNSEIRVWLSPLSESSPYTTPSTTQEQIPLQWQPITHVTHHHHHAAPQHVVQVLDWVPTDPRVTDTIRWKSDIIDGQVREVSSKVKAWLQNPWKPLALPPPPVIRLNSGSVLRALGNNPTPRLPWPTQKQDPKKK